MHTFPKLHRYGMIIFNIMLFEHFFPIYKERWEETRELYRKKNIYFLEMFVRVFMSQYLLCKVVR